MISKQLSVSSKRLSVFGNQWVAGGSQQLAVDQPVAGSSQQLAVDQPVAVSSQQLAVDQSLAVSGQQLAVDQPLAGSSQQLAVDQPVAVSSQQLAVDQPVAVSNQQLVVGEPLAVSSRQLAVGASESRIFALSEVEGTHHASCITHHVSLITHHASRITWIALSIALILLLSLTFWWFFAPRDDGALAEIRRRGTLRVGLDASFPPFETLDKSGQIVGLDVDLARAIATDLGVELGLVNIGFDGLYDALLARRVDIIISGLPYDPRWTQDVAYTRNYFNAGQILVALVDESTITTVEDLAEHTVAVEWGSQADMEGRRLERELAEVTLLRRSTADQALAALFNGEADAAIVDAVSGVSAFPRGLKIVTYLTDEWYAAAVHIESQELLEAVNQSLARLEESGKMAKIQASWLHGQ